MERRVILAFVLALLVAIVPSILFPPKKMPPRHPATSGTPDSTRVPSPASLAPAPGRTPGQPAAPLVAAPPETVWVTSPLYRYGFSTAGGALVSAQLLQYRSFAPSDSGRRVDLIPRGRPAFVLRLVAGSDTVR